MRVSCGVYKLKSHTTEPRKAGREADQAWSIRGFGKERKSALSPQEDVGFGPREWHLPSLKGRLWCVNQGHPCPAIWDPCGKCPQGPARDSIIMKSSKSRSLGRACTFNRHSSLQPSLNLLQVFRSKRGRQQLLDRPDYKCAIWLGHVHGPVSAKLEKRAKLCEGRSWD